MYLVIMSAGDPTFIQCTLFPLSGDVFRYGACTPMSYDGRDIHIYSSRSVVLYGLFIYLFILLSAFVKSRRGDAMKQAAASEEPGAARHRGCVDHDALC